MVEVLVNRKRFTLSERSFDKAQSFVSRFRGSAGSLIRDSRFRGLPSSARKVVFQSIAQRRAIERAAPVTTTTTFVDEGGQPISIDPAIAEAAIARQQAQARFKAAITPQRNALSAVVPIISIKSIQDRRFKEFTPKVLKQILSTTKQTAGAIERADIAVSRRVTTPIFQKTGIDVDAFAKQAGRALTSTERAILSIPGARLVGRKGFEPVEQFQEGTTRGIIMGPVEKPVTTAAAIGVGFAAAKVLPPVLSFLGKGGIVAKGTAAAVKVGAPAAFVATKAVQIGGAETALEAGQIFGESISTEIIPFAVGAKAATITNKQWRNLFNKIDEAASIATGTSKVGKAKTKTKTKQKQIKRVTKEQLKKVFEKLSDKEVSHIFKTKMKDASAQAKANFIATYLEQRTGTQMFLESGEINKGNFAFELRRFRPSTTPTVTVVTPAPPTITAVPAVTQIPFFAIPKTIQKAKQQSTQLNFFTTATTTAQKLDQKTRQDQKVGQLQFFRTAQTTAQTSAQAQASATKQISKQTTKQTTAQVQPTLNFFRPTPIKPGGKTSIGGFKLPKSKTKVIKKKRKKQVVKPRARAGYNVLVRPLKKKKYVKANLVPLRLTQAKDLGANISDTTLGGSFKIVKSKRKATTPPRVRIPSGYFSSNSTKFRNYKIRQGERIPLKNKWIEKRSKRLDTKGEVNKITVLSKIAILKKKAKGRAKK